MKSSRLEKRFNSLLLRSMETKASTIFSIHVSSLTADDLMDFTAELLSKLPTEMAYAKNVWSWYPKE